LFNKDIKATTVEVDTVTICCAEEELHKTEGLEHGRQAFWRCTQALAGNGGGGWAMLSKHPATLAWTRAKGAQHCHATSATRQPAKETWMAWQPLTHPKHS